MDCEIEELEGSQPAPVAVLWIAPHVSGDPAVERHHVNAVVKGTTARADWDSGVNRVKCGGSADSRCGDDV
jgi:hypothetical protein